MRDFSMSESLLAVIWCKAVLQVPAVGIFLDSPSESQYSKLLQSFRSDYAAAILCVAAGQFSTAAGFVHACEGNDLLRPAKSDTV